MTEPRVTAEDVARSIQAYGDEDPAGAARLDRSAALVRALEAVRVAAKTHDCRDYYYEFQVGPDESDYACSMCDALARVDEIEGGGE